MEPRQWQKAALAACKETNPALVEAFPGSGKTIFAALEVQRRIESGEINGVVVVVPTKPLKESVQRDMAEVGIELKDQQKDRHPFPTEYAGVVVCYAQLPNLVDTFGVWCRNGRRLAFVFDEVHHASENNVWGDAANDCARMAARVLAMTGTPFRGDGRRIAFVNYSDDGQCVPTYSYGYAAAVRDDVCRVIEFETDDGVAEFVADALHTVRISETPEHLEPQVKAAVFETRHDFLNKTIAKADHKLTEMRTDDHDAAGLIVCRPGYDDNDNRHLHQVAALVEEITGEKPVVVKHDDASSADKIAKFRTSTARWLLSVRMVSEGIDIKRLRIGVMATAPTTELLFRQIIGRVIRVEDGCEHHRATLLMAKLPRLVEWAGRIEKDATAGLREKREREQAEERAERQSKGLLTLSASHEDGGAVAMGIGFNATEIQAAEEERNSDPLLRGVSVLAVAQMRRRHGIQATATDVEVEPEQKRRKRLRDNLNRVVRNLAAQRDLPHKDVYTDVFRFVGAKNLDDLCDNMPVEKLRSALDYVTAWRADL